MTQSGILERFDDVERKLPRGVDCVAAVRATLLWTVCEHIRPRSIVEHTNSGVL